MARYVSKEAYEQIKHDADGNAVIYGVPVGVNYSDFQNRANKEVSDENASLTEDQTRNVMWTGLDPNSSSTYSACLQAQVLASRGLHLAVKSATESDIALIVSWAPQGSDPSSTGLSWYPTSLPGVSLPKTVTAGEAIVILPRPNGQQTLAVNTPGFGASVILERFPKLPDQTVPLPIALGAKDYNRLRAVAVGLSTDNGNPNREWGEAITSTSPGVGQASWDFSVPRAGTWTVTIEYASAESRPANVYIDQLLLAPHALAPTTATFCVDLSTAARCAAGGTTRTEQVGTPLLTKGAHALRIEAGPSFPHIRTVRLAFVSDN